MRDVLKVLMMWALSPLGTVLNTGLLAVTLLACATVAAGLALGGSGPLPGLSGQRLSDGHAYALIAACWAASTSGGVTAPGSTTNVRIA